MYGQKNFNELQGRDNPANGKKPKYSIRQIGCFLVAISNLLKRFGVNVDPLTLNAFFRDRGVYIDVDDGVLDDLFWQAITTFAPHIVVEKTAPKERVGELPGHTNSIVRIKAKNNFGLHFCLFDGSENGVAYVIDSWDGSRRPMSYYGPAIGYAQYKNAKPQPVVPINPPTTPKQPTPTSDDMIVQSGWGISHCLKFRGYPKEQYIDPTKWQWVANINGVAKWQDFKLKPGQVIKLPSYRAPEAAVPTPVAAPVVAPPQSEVVEITVQAGWGISHVLKAAGYSRDQFIREEEWDRVARLNGSNERLRLRPGQVVKVYRSPLSAPQPPAPAPVEPPAATMAAPAPTNPPVADSKPADVIPTAPDINLASKKDAWKDTFTETGAGKYIAVKSVLVKDLEGLHISLQLRSRDGRNRPTEVTVGGMFEKDGNTYYRSLRHVQQGKWYGIPVDAVRPEADANDFDDLDMDLDFRGEAREAVRNFNLRQLLLSFIATIQGWFSRKKK